MHFNGISEIVLIVKDVRASARFYQEVVGLEPMTEADDEWAWFWSGRPDHSARVAVHKGTLLHEQHSPHPQGERWGHVHYAFEVSPEHIDEALDVVRRAGVEVYGPTQFKWMNATGYYFYDPDGNLLEYWSPD